MVSKKVCIVGAGLSGLCTVKELKEKGHQVTCFEASSSVGGSFCADAKSSKVYDSLLLTVSNFFMAYSGFPIDVKKKRRYWSANEYLSYLDRYVEHFELSESVLLNTRVQHIDKIGSSYNVQVQTELEKVASMQFDAVVICTGTNRVPYMPEVAGAVNFQGDILHTADYTEPSRFAGKRVVCVGAGESSADIIHDIANVADDCSVLMRSKPSIVARWINDETNDAYTSLAFSALGRKGMNAFMRLKAKSLLLTKRKLSKKEKIQYQWQLDSPGFMNRFLTKNDVFLDDIANGNLKAIKSEIKNITKGAVELMDGTSIKADVIIFNTGYRQEFSILDSIVQPSDFRDLYKHMFHPEIGENLAFIGWARPSQGGVPSISEMQARYLAQLLSGERVLPKGQVLHAEINKDKEIESKHFKDSPALTSLVDYHDYMKSLSSLIGCRPKVNFLFEPQLTYKMIFGCHLSNFYRLNGPGENRKEAIKIIKGLPTASSLRRNTWITILFLFFKLKQVKPNFSRAK
ncbi:Ferredoxin--NADP reductase [Pseudoalteromonas holothuriae]|uniref:Ferredoxin--NADP reductase n=1 Tax=Pseudoalteromonas holothuriae TaxID=2963714 RepID=A0ABM9GIQ7_9GAMM|nr:NAD(P)-binding domain-containing protein [Pseudoalteromonas sp. CIP111951]CAH9060252.1 Ferredoxin--NADP reductase [Pseudoalteromonas sp. CIP111951]